MKLKCVAIKINISEAVSVLKSSAILSVESVTALFPSTTPTRLVVTRTEQITLLLYFTSNYLPV